MWTTLDASFKASLFEGGGPKGRGESNTQPPTPPVSLREPAPSVRGPFVTVAQTFAAGPALHINVSEDRRRG